MDAAEMFDGITNLHDPAGHNLRDDSRRTHNLIQLPLAARLSCAAARILTMRSPV